MKAARWVLLTLIVLGAISCGGGGGGGGATSAQMSGRVLNVITGGSLNPAGQIQVGDARALTDLADGSFSLAVPAGTTSLTVDTRNSSFGVWVFTVPTVTGTTDVGDLWVGPEKVTVTGTVRDSTSNNPVANTTINFAGRTAVSNGSGVFALQNVAYATSSTASFAGITGSATATGYFLSSFTAGNNVAAAGVVTVDDILITPSTDSNPPSTPYNIFGKVSPSNLALGTTVTVSQGGTPFRQAAVGTDDRYYVWLPVGTYTFHFANGLHSVPDQTVTITQANQILQRDVTLN